MVRRGPTRKLTPPKVLASKLFEAGRSRAAQHGLTLQPTVTNQLRSLAQKGANKILAVAKTKEPTAQDAYMRAAVRVASEAMAALIDEMTSARYRIPNYPVAHPNSLGEETLVAAKKLLCPLWPFC